MPEKNKICYLFLYRFWLLLLLHTSVKYILNHIRTGKQSTGSQPLIEKKIVTRKINEKKEKITTAYEQGVLPKFVPNFLPVL